MESRATRGERETRGDETRNRDQRPSTCGPYGVWLGWARDVLVLLESRLQCGTREREDHFLRCRGVRIGSSNDEGRAGEERQSRRGLREESRRYECCRRGETSGIDGRVKTRLKPEEELRMRGVDGLTWRANGTTSARKTRVNAAISY